LVSQSAKAKLSDKPQLLPVMDTTHMAKTTMRSLPPWRPAGFSRNPEAEGRSGPGQRLGPMSHPTSLQSVRNSKEEVCRRMGFFCLFFFFFFFFLTPVPCHCWYLEKFVVKETFKDLISTSSTHEASLDLGSKPGPNTVQQR
jgi:hypothetical protein